MELAAPEEEVAAAFAGCGGGGCPFLLYGEDRAHTIRMAHFAAHRWFTPEYAAGHPGGRLAQNWLRNVGQVYSPANPWYQMRWGAWFPNGDGTRISPLFQIGAGESYTRFNVTDLRVPAADVLGAAPAASAAFNVSVRVSNMGGMAGDATVFVTYSKQTDGVARWEKMLCGFEKVCPCMLGTMHAWYHLPCSSPPCRL